MSIPRFECPLGQTVDGPRVEIARTICEKEVNQGKIPEGKDLCFQARVYGRSPCAGTVEMGSAE